ncbi:hypothetical protein TpMuguga_04g02505 [Theileria parva strain Muguga]|uniref:uncharacterized protein n=1 Tax=Theileria parva strain Muguga TaxID=333668 RepID=UPI001C61F5B9|nr:uncharacterized protein TpMuguga_04g02505 [Theileria parva strain Muguga]KAF5153242.1 hypothetical protein TpMuguga_04g02505 [Theileria parva strain Muguga]
MNVQGYKLLLYVVSNDGDDWETPNALIIPLKTPNSEVTLADIRKLFPLPGNYHFRTRYRHNNSFVWLDLTREDEPLQSADNVFYMKVLRLGNGSGGENFCKVKANLITETAAENLNFDLI